MVDASYSMGAMIIRLAQCCCCCCAESEGRRVQRAAPRGLAARHYYLHLQRLLFLIGFGFAFGSVVVLLYGTWDGGRGAGYRHNCGAAAAAVASAAIQPRKCINSSSDSDSDSGDNSVFPTLSDTLEMATLSSMVYAFHKEDYGNDDVDNNVCERINTANYTAATGRTINDRPIPDYIKCEWYHHDWTGGAQIMIVSSVVNKYVAVVFAGTDDLRTSLTDVNVRMAEFGSSVSKAANIDTDITDAAPSSSYPVYNVSLPDDSVRVHAGFDHEVFDRNLFGEIVARVEAVRSASYAMSDVDDFEHDYRLFTTGHSLGAANAVLVAVGLVQYYDQVRRGEIVPFTNNTHTHNTLPPPPPPPVDHLVSINFGCPQTGNTAWRDFIHSDPTMRRRLSIWRFVLGWDLVPRLPEVLQHVGHTVQLKWNDNATATAFYHHIGNASLQLAGVPFGWGAKPFVWVPGALYSHIMSRYWKFLTEWQSSSKSSSSSSEKAWVNAFECVKDEPPRPDDHHDNNRPLPNVDDDFYVEPPDDDTFVASTAAQQLLIRRAVIEQ